MAWIDALPTGIGGLLSTGLSLLGVKQSKDYQHEMAEQQMKWQSEEAEKAREWSQQEWQRQFDLTNAYNLPVEQAKRLQEAGVNPYYMYGGASSAASGVASQGSTPSSPVVASPVPDYSGVIAGGFHNIRGLVESLRTLSEVKKTGIENSRLSAMLDAQIAETVARMNNEQASADLTNLTKKFEEIFGTVKRSKELEKLTSEYVKAYADARLAVSQGKYYDEAVLNQASERLLNDAKRGLTDKQLNMLEIDLKYRASQLESEIARNRGAAAAGFASAEEGHEMAVSERTFRDSRASILSAEADLKEIDASLALQTKQQRVAAVLSEYARANIITSQEEERLKQEVFKSNTQELDKKIERLREYSNIMKTHVETADKFKDFLYRNDMKLVPFLNW